MLLCIISGHKFVDFIVHRSQKSASDPTPQKEIEDLELTEEELAGIVSGSVFVFIFFTAGFIFVLRLIRHKCFLGTYEIYVPVIETDREDRSDTVNNENTEEKTGYKMLHRTVVINAIYERQISVDSGRGSLHSEGNVQLPPILEEVIEEKPKKTNNDFKVVNGYVLQNQDENQRRAFGEIKNPLTTECKEADDQSISSSDYTTMQDLNLSTPNVSKQTLKSQQNDDDVTSSSDIDIYETNFSDQNNQLLSNSDYTTMQDLNLCPPDISKQTFKPQQKDDDVTGSSDILIYETNFADQNNEFGKQITPTTTDCNTDERHSDYTKSDCIFSSNEPDRNDFARPMNVNNLNYIRSGKEYLDNMKSGCIYQSGAMDITYNPYTRSVDGNTCSQDVNKKKCSGHINCNYIFQSNAMKDIHIQNTRPMNEMNCSFDMNDTEDIYGDDIIESNVTDNITRTVNENSYIYSTDIRAPSGQSLGYILHSEAEMKGCSDIHVTNIEKKFFLGHESENGEKGTLSTEEKTNCLPFINTLRVEIQDEDIDDYLLSSSESQLSMHESDIEMSIGFLNEKSTNKNLPPIENQTIVSDDYVPLHSAMALWNMR